MRTGTHFFLRAVYRILGRISRPLANSAIVVPMISATASTAAGWLKSNLPDASRTPKALEIEATKEFEHPRWYEYHRRQVIPIGNHVDLIKMPAWRRRRAQRNKIVRKTFVNGYMVSTVFLALDHADLFRPNAGPLVFETMVFNLPNGKIDYSGVHQDRTSTHREALKMHWQAVALAKEDDF